MRIRRNLLVWSTVAALVVAIVGGWLFSSASDDGVDANLTNPGVVQDPTIGTNAVANGEELPPVNLPSVATGDLTAIFPQGRPLVINFWFSTCEPCRREMPALQAVSQQLSGIVDIIGVNPNDTAEVAANWASDIGVTFPLYTDRDAELLTEVGIGTMPTTLFVSTDGVIVDTHAGEITAAELRAAITTSLGIKV
ncbi:MAG: TlpA family protein disulfide reductase [Ilumatobacteraceae bacterium]|nr:TlpA family protein disulfide reductase [Ilumatobacteraceae bacterium]